jgi:bifunctional non-homologous end joining protein LigD
VSQDSGGVPNVIEPMKATAMAELPVDADRWAYEIKWDGVRTVAFATGTGLRLQSRSLRDVTVQYPEIAALGASLSPGTVIDGEIAALDESGKPSFERLQSRINLASARDLAARQVDTPVTFLVFDLLYQAGSDVMGLAYIERRGLLENLGLEGAGFQVPRAHLGDGPALLEATRQQGLEGLMAKRADSTYLPGRRSRAWVKVKNFRRQEFVVGGWLEGSGARAGRIGALLAGYHGAGGLRYAGRVGTGFNSAELERLQRRVEPLARSVSPFGPEPALPVEVARAGHWVEPELVVEVAFSEWTQAGTLRAPSYKGERSDKDPAAVVRET